MDVARTKPSDTVTGVARTEPKETEAGFAGTEPYEKVMGVDRTKLNGTVTVDAR